MIIEFFCYAIFSALSKPTGQCCIHVGLYLARLRVALRTALHHLFPRISRSEVEDSNTIAAMKKYLLTETRYV